MLVYATTSDLTNWVDPIPVNAPALLRTASLRVREATMTARYDVDSNGLPSDAAVLQAFKDATCAHVVALVTANLDPAAGGAITGTTVKVAKSVGSASVSYADAAAATAGRAWLAGNLCPDGVAILLAAGLVPGTAWTVG